MTVEELRRLFFFNCEEHAEKYVGMFKLSFFLMGVNMIDLANLKEMKNGRLDFNRAKTGHLYSMKVEPEAMELFDKYSGENYLLFILDHWTNDEFFRRKMNKELQKVGPMQRKPDAVAKRVSTVVSDAHKLLGQTFMGYNSFRIGYCQRNNRGSPRT